MEKVSIVVPLYKNERYIRETMYSILNSLYGNIEIIVVDDCGKDESLEICLDLAKENEKIKILRNTRNLGTAKTILKGVLEAKGDYIFVAAADDIFSENRILDCLNIFRTCSPFLIFGDASIIDGFGKELDLVYTNDLKVSNENIVIEQFKRNQCLGATMAFINDKQLFIKCGDELLNKSDDFGFVMESIIKGLPIYYLRKPIIKYRIHDSNQSRDTSKMNWITKEITTHYLLENYEERLKKVYDYPNIEYDIAKAIQFIYLGKLDLAKSLLESTSDSESNQGLWEKYFYLGVIEYHSNNVAQSFHYFKKSIVFNKTHAATWNNIGVIEHIAGYHEKAKQTFKNALLLKADYMDAEKNLQLSEGPAAGNLIFTNRTVFDQLMAKEKYDNYFN